MESEKSIREEFLNGKISRRDFVIRSLGLGMSLSAIGTVLSACAAEPTKAPAAPAAPAAPPAPAAPKDVQNLIIAGAKDVISLDPHRQNDADSTYVFELIHDTIVVLDRDYKPLPHLAESWTVSPDGLTYTFKFRKNVKFHDGSTLTADDVIFTLERVKAAKWPEGRKHERILMVKSFKKVDDTTVEMTLEYPYSPFIAALSVIHILPKAVVQKMGDDPYAKAPIGCGPFKFKEWVTNDHVTLEGFGDYWMVKPKLQTITIRPIPENSVAVANLLAGDVDFINDVVSNNLKQIQAAASKGVSMVNKAGMNVVWLSFRMLDKTAADLRFRQAIYHATDFEAAIKSIFPAELAVRSYGLIPPGFWPNDEEYLKKIALKKDTEKAKSLFKALMDEGIMAKDYKVIVAPPPDDARIRLSEIMVTDLKALGINAEVVRMEWTTYLTELEKGTQSMIYMLGAASPIPDPDGMVRNPLSKNGSHGRYMNIAQFKDNEKWEKMLIDGQKETDRAAREKIYIELQRMMMENVFHIPLFIKAAVIAKYDYVKDLDVNPMLRWNLVKPWANVYIDGKKK